jgi:hypothetical protein
MSCAKVSWADFPKSLIINEMGRNQTLLTPPQKVDLFYHQGLLPKCS